MKISRAFYVYGAFLIAAGVAGFLSNPEKAKTALISGGFFGSLACVLGWLESRGWSRTRQAGLAVTGLLAVVFTWRSSASWMAVADGVTEKTFAAALITGMLAATLLMLARLLKRA
jgi:uncharacterized membrane protein (UPF0136 family)